MARCFSCRGAGYYYFDSATSETYIPNYDPKARSFQEYWEWIESRSDQDMVELFDCSACGGSGFDEERTQRRLI